MNIGLRGRLIPVLLAFFFSFNIGAKAQFFQAPSKNDRFADILWHSKLTGGANYSWLLNRYYFGGADNVGNSDTWDIVGIADFDRNGLDDLLLRIQSGPGSGQNGVWLTQTSGFTAQMLPYGDPAWNVVGVGDFDGDGYFDILWYHAGTGQLVAWKMGGSNGLTFQTGIALPTNTDLSWSPIAVCDINGDTNPDIVFQHQSSRQVKVWKMSGTTMNSSVILNIPGGGTLPSDYSISAIAPFTPYGNLDFALRYTGTGTAANKIWHMTGVNYNYSGDISSYVNGQWTPIYVDQTWSMQGAWNQRTDRMLAVTALRDCRKITFTFFKISTELKARLHA